MESLIGLSTCGINASGITRLLVVPMNEVQSIADNAAGIYANFMMSNVNLTGPYYNVDFDKDTCTLTHDLVRDEHGVAYKIILTCDCSKNVRTKRNNLFINDDAEYLVLVRDANGYYYLIGSMDGWGEKTGMRLRYTLTTGANNKRDENKYKLEWTMIAKEPARFAVAGNVVVADEGDTDPAE